MPRTQTRLLFTGPFHADHRARALEALCTRSDRGARDILYIVASGAARRRAIAGLLARRAAVFGLRVVALRGLPAELARRAHAKKPDRIDSVIDELLVERAIRVASGGRFDASTPVAGLASKAASIIDLLERNGGNPDQLSELLAHESSGDGARVLAEAWNALTVRRARHGASDAALLASAADLLHSHPAVLQGLDLLVLEDLSLLTTVERSLVRSAISAAPGDVIACHGYAAQLPDAPATRSLATLRELADWVEQPCSPPAGREGDFVARLFAVPAAKVDGSGTRQASAPLPVAITCLEANGDLGEVRVAARVARRHLDAGVPPHEIALIVHGSASRYRELVREVFTAASIPVALALPRRLADSALGGVLLHLLELAIEPTHMTRETSLAVARAPHVDLRSDERDRLQRQVIVKGYLGLDGWDALALKTLGSRGTNRINRLKRAVADARSGFQSVASASQAARVVRRLAKDLRLVNNAYFARRRAARGVAATDALVAPSAVAVREDNLAWEAIESALDVTVPQMLEIDRGAAGTRGLAYAATWLAMLQRVMRATTQVPESIPLHAVQFRRTAPGGDAPARVTIILGLLEKVFPRQARQDPFLGDALRTAIRARLGWELATSAEGIERERECFVRAVSSATEALYLSYSAIDGEGRPAVRSFFIDDLQAAIGGEHSMAVERSEGVTAIGRLSDALTPSDLVAAIAHDIWQHLPRTADSDTRRAAAFHAIEALARRNADVSVVRHGRRVSGRPSLDGVLPPDVPHLTLTLSASQLKSISQCTYMHFVEKVLSPAGLVPPEYNAVEKGKLVHDAVMHWATRLDGWRRGEAALGELHEWVRAQLAAWSPAMRGADRTARATDADLERLDELLRAELAMLRAPGVAQPKFTELAFGEEMDARGPRDAASRLEPFQLTVATSKGESTVKFRGSMDRVDVVTIGGRRYGVIIDYKTGRTSKYHAEEMMAGTDLQLRLYLLVLEKFWGITPVGALYLGFGDGVRRGAVRADFAKVIAGVDSKAVAVLPPEEWDGFVGETVPRIARLVDRLVRLDVTPAPRDHKCGFCELTPICRYERWAPEVAGV